LHDNANAYHNSPEAVCLEEPGPTDTVAMILLSFGGLLNNLNSILVQDFQVINQLLQFDRYMIRFWVVFWCSMGVKILQVFLFREQNNKRMRTIGSKLSNNQCVSVGRNVQILEDDSTIWVVHYEPFSFIFSFTDIILYAGFLKVHQILE